MKKLLCAWLVLLPALGFAAETYTLKFATLAPQGSTWMNIIGDWAKQVEKDSSGRLVFKLYPGGISGDETDVLRKIRFGQLHGAALTGHGIGEIYPPARVLELPFLFRNYQEIDYVRTQVMPDLRSGFRKNEFELLGWMEIGFLQFFSKQPIDSFAGLKQRKVWLWQGDALGGALYAAAGVSPIPLPITEVYTSLSTGLLDTVIAPPLGAIALQWFTKTPYMTDTPIANGIGALVVTSAFFNKLPPDLQALLIKSGNEAGMRLINATRRDGEKALGVLRRHGIKSSPPWKDISEAELLSIRDRAMAELAKRDYIPQRNYQQVQKALSDYRAAQPKPSN